MTDVRRPSTTLPERARRAARDRPRRQATARALARTVAQRAVRRQEMPEWETHRRVLTAQRARGRTELSALAEAFARAAEACGARVYRCADGGAACRQVLAIARRAGARRVVSSKSMVAEEIGLRAFLQSPADGGPGLVVTEGDLGEYLVQVRGEAPSHITAPAVHLSAAEVVASLREAGIALSAAQREPPAITAAVRAHLRPDFLEVDLAITGANALVVDTGSVLLVENEGNIRLATARATEQVVVATPDKLVAHLGDLEALLALLAPSATGQRQTSYVSLLSGPRRAGDRDGPRALHIVIVDAGRAAVAADPVLGAALGCVRCGACINACPVFRHVGGHVFEFALAGPIGQILRPALRGAADDWSYPYLCTSCGACGEVCPAGIDLPHLLLELRARVHRSGAAPPRERVTWAALTQVIRRPGVLAAVGRLASSAPARGLLGGVADRLVPGRVLPIPAAQSFFGRLRAAGGLAELVGPVRPLPTAARVDPGDGAQVGPPEGDAVPSASRPVTERLRARFAPLVAHGDVAEAHGFLRGPAAPAALAASLAGFLEAHPEISRLAASDEPAVRAVVRHLGPRAAAVEWLTPGRAVDLAAVDLCLTGADAVIADTAQVLIRTGPQRPRGALCLPAHHVVVANVDEIVPDLGRVWRDLAARPLPADLVLIAGPSRTADIEKEIVVPAHGPRTLILLLLDGS